MPSLKDKSSPSAMVPAFSEAENRKQPIRLLWIVLGLRSGLFLMEASIGLRVHSLSLLAVAGHMTVDLLAIAVAIVGAELNDRSSLKTGHYSSRIEAGAALMNGLLLLGIAAFIIWSAVQSAQTPTIEAGLPMLVIAAVGFLVKGVSVTLLHVESKHSLNVRGVFLHAIADAANSISLLLAALAVIFLNWLWADTVASLFVALFVLANAFFLIQESLLLLRTDPDRNTLTTSAKDLEKIT